MTFADLHRWHRRLSLAAAPFALAWALSGALHPILSSTQLRPATQARPPAPPGLHAGDHRLQPLLEARGIPRIRQARIVALAGEPVYLVELPGAARKLGISARTGRDVPDADEAYAVQLTRHYLGGRGTGPASATLVTGFSGDYPDVNRLLPVYRVDVAGGSRAFVETGTDRLSALTTPGRAALLSAFRVLHTWGSGAAPGLLRVGGMALSLGLILASALSGLAVYGLGWSRFRRVGLARAHRAVGLVVGATTLGLAVTGFWHLQRQEARRGVGAPQALDAAFVPAELPASTQPAAFAGLARVGGAAAYRIPEAAPGLPAEHEHAHGPQGEGGRGSSWPAGPAPWVRADSGVRIVDGEAVRARELAAHFAALRPGEIQAVETVSTFGGEYGFIQKRLPVARVRLNRPGGDRLYVEPATGALAARITDADAREGRVFSSIHKAEFLTPWIGKDARNAVLVGVALANALVPLLGLALTLRRGLGGSRSRAGREACATAAASGGATRGGSGRAGEAVP